MNNRLNFFHAHPLHRARQLRWVIPLVAVLLGAALAVLALQYLVSGQQVQAEFFRAHKTISNTSQLLRRGTLVGAVAVLLAALVITLWALRMSHRFVRPVHTLHRAIEELATGDLGVRVQLESNDEFHELGVALNRLVTEFSATLVKAHYLSDVLVNQSEEGAANPNDKAAGARLHARMRELDAALDFFRLTPEHVIRDGQD